MLFNDWVRFDHSESRYSDRDLIRVFADENVPTYDFLIENGVEFNEKPIRSPDASTVDRIFVTKEWHIPSQVYAPRRGRNGSGLVRRMEESARKKGVQIFLKHKMTSIVREKHNAGRVLGIITIAGSNPVNIQARKGVIIATGGHTGNVNFRRIFDPRLTEEYQQACSPYVHQGADVNWPRWISAPRSGRPPIRPLTRQRRSPRRGTSAAAGATRRWCTSPTARCSSRRAPPV
jgi:succinate dehydrogenase/fumarate reductase flavoprotein subunit